MKQLFPYGIHGQVPNALAISSNVAVSPFYFIDSILYQEDDLDIIASMVTLVYSEIARQSE